MKKNLFSRTSFIICWCASNVCLFFNFAEISLLFCALYSLIFFIHSFNRFGRTISVFIIFLFFHIAYGLTYPIAYTTTSIHEFMPIIFNSLFKLDEYVFLYNIASFGLFLGSLPITNGNFPRIVSNALQKKKIPFCYQTALVSVVLASVMELINFFRAGGLQTLALGKGAYIGAISDAGLILPSDTFFIIGIICLAILIIKNNKISFYILLSLPYVAIKFITGQRGGLFVPIFIIMLAFFYYKDRKFYSLKNLFLIFISLGLLSIMSIYKSVIINTVSNDMDLTYFYNYQHNNDKNSILFSLFGELYAPSLNINEYLTANENERTLMFGESYLIGLLQPIPQFLFPITKPKQITYVFRDKFFPSQAEVSSTAGTGFSSILEAMMNFGYIGVFLVYILVSRFIYLLEFFNRKKNNESFYTAIYLSFCLLAFTFHRFAFSFLFANYFIMACCYVFTLFLVTILSTKRNKCS